MPETQNVMEIRMDSTRLQAARRKIQVVEIDTDNRRQVGQFLNLPFRLYANVPQWVPPLSMDARKVLDRKHYAFYGHGQVLFLLAMEGERVLGRMAVLENITYNQVHNRHTAYFYMFECEDDLEASQAMFEKGMSWAKGRSLDTMIGPRGFTVFNGSGLLVRGFEHRPAFGMPYHLPYYGKLIEASGFTIRENVVSGYLDKNLRFPEKLHRASELIQKRRGLHIQRFKKKSDLRALIPQLKDMYNGAIAGTQENTPLTDEDTKELANQMLWFADPSLIKIVMKGEQAVGFLFAYPDISAALQRTRGKVLPFGWITLLHELKRTKWLNINGAGMVEGYRGLGGTAILFSEMYKSVAESRRYEYADLVQISSDNDKMLREMRELGVDFYKTHRMYERAL
jgi:hypothetical protein